MSEHQIFVRVNGVSKTPQEWSDFLGISVTSFFMRLQDDRNVDVQLFGVKANVPKVKKVERNGRNVQMLTLKGKTQTLKEWCNEIGLGMTSLRYRLEKGFTEEQILQSRQATNSKDLPITKTDESKQSVEKKPTSKKEKAPSPSSVLVEKKKTVKPKEETVKTIKLLGTELPLKEWADTLMISVQALEFRMNEGWSEQEILNGKRDRVTETIITKNPDKFVIETGRDRKLDQEVCFEGDIKTLREWSVELGISQNVIRSRYNKGFRGQQLLFLEPKYKRKQQA
jgi:hypothetical protein